jgi:hypothetical protein
VRARGSHRPFIWAGGRRRGVAGGSNGGVNGFNAIEDRGEVKRGNEGGGGMMAGRVIAQAAFEGEAGRRRVAGDDEEKRQWLADVRRGWS